MIGTVKKEKTDEIGKVKLQTGRKYLQKIDLIRNDYLKYTVLKLSNKNDLFKKWATNLNRHLTKEDM